MSIAVNFEEVLSAFTKHNVEFMIAGGYAVNFHGYNRSTSDLDIWVKPVEANKMKIVNALLKLKFSKAAIQQVKELDFAKPFAFSIGAEPIDIDIFNSLTGVQYAVAERKMISFRYSDKLSVNYIHLTDLIVNKMLTNRTKDRLDVEELQKISKLRK
jgi:hypothetical protein